MAKICQCRCDKAECTQCDQNVGYAIGRFMQDVRVVDGSKVGTTADDGKLIYTGKLEVDNGGICDILYPVEKVDFNCDRFIPELVLQNGIKGSMADFVNKYREKNGGCEKALANIELFEQGKMFISPFKVGTTLSPYKKEKDSMVERYKIQSVKFTVAKDSFGNLRQEIIVSVNEPVGGRRHFTPSELLEHFSVSGTTSKASAEFVKMTDGGIVKPVCVKYKEFSILIDNCYIYIDDGNKTVPIGVWGAYDTQKSESLDLIIGNKKFKKVKDAIEALSKVRKFIAPYWCAKSNIIIAD